MKFSWRSREPKPHDGPESRCVRGQNGLISYNSTLTKNSKSTPGVAFTIRRISFGRRMELSRKIRGISQKIEFLTAGDELKERIEANILAQEIDSTYLEWGLAELAGLTIDGEAATPALLMANGPDELTTEIVLAIKAECGLSEEERKN